MPFVIDVIVRLLLLAVFVVALCFVLSLPFLYVAAQFKVPGLPVRTFLRALLPRGSPCEKSAANPRRDVGGL